MLHNKYVSSKHNWTLQLCLIIKNNDIIINNNNNNE